MEWLEAMFSQKMWSHCKMEVTTYREREEKIKSAEFGRMAVRLKGFVPTDTVSRIPSTGLHIHTDSGLYIPAGTGNVKSCGESLIS